ncbi:iron-containing redox enzyme family protein [Nocardia crassostreae]|uniref:iron-containing redox enzyme family protein n=1 Tax=Nocardia crassostreae TaxID=53428 RepID=UPI0014725C68|nr:iron-containing redox enzyme family protein [Nocardia crassostreae]
MGDYLYGTDSAPESQEERSPLLEVLEVQLEKGLAGGDTAALLDVHRSAYAIYETLLGHPFGAGARHERSSWFNAFRRIFEDRVLNADIETIADRLPSAADAARPEFVRDWMLAAAHERSALDSAVETYLAERATADELARFIEANGYLNYRFYDVLALSQTHFMETVKNQISHHLWEECGEGNPLMSHTVLFTRSLRKLRLELPAVPPWEDWRPYAGYNVHFVLAFNRRHYFKVLGGLAMPELFGSGRDAAVVAGLQRCGFALHQDFEFFFNHMEADAEHGPEWLDGVVLPVVAAEPEAGHELIVGGAIRMLAMRRYNEYLALRLGVTEGAVTDHE